MQLPNVRLTAWFCVVQGSTSVYSKKVEYLHALVYQTLELITAQKRVGTKVNECAANIVSTMPEMTGGGGVCVCVGKEL